MLRDVPPMSNNERQRRFQERHPGYDRLRKSRQRAACAERVAAARAAALARPQPLMLPEPVEDLVLADLIALAAARARETVAVPVGSGR